MRQLRRLVELRAAIRRVRAAYQEHHARPPQLWPPRRYSEKVQWRKLFDSDPLYTVLCDKLAARDFIRSRWPEAPLPPLLWQGDDPDAIPFETLLPPYALKSSHGCGDTIFVRPGDALDEAAVRAVARFWLGRCHGIAADEPGYVGVPRRLLAERLLTLPDGNPPIERKIYVFGGRAAVVNTVFVEAGRLRNGAFHTPEWQRLSWRITRDLTAMPFPRPPMLPALLAAAERLAAGLEHVRVDFYDGGDRFCVGEITVYPWSGHAVLSPDVADYMLGAFWRLRQPRCRAAAALLGVGGGNMATPVKP